MYRCGSTMSRLDAGGVESRGTMSGFAQEAQCPASISPIPPSSPSPRRSRRQSLSREDGIALYASSDLIGIGQLADHARHRINGDRVYFMVNRHINPTNICRNRCKFCAFARSAGEEGAYEMTLDAVAGRAAEGAADGAYEIHIVSGLHPDWSYEFYVDMVRASPRGDAEARDRPGVHRRGDRAHGDHQRQVHARGATRPQGRGARRASRWRCRDLLGSHADGSVGQEDEVGRLAAIHGEAHSLGIATNCTMLYGHIETHEERVDHLIRLREQQDETRRLPRIHPARIPPRQHRARGPAGTTGFEDLKTLAIARLMLDNIPHIKAFWIMVGLKVAQISTCFGVDDIDGTVVEEKITHMAGATTPEALSKDDLIGMIAETGHVAVERDTLYRIVELYAEETESPSWDAGPIERDDRGDAGAVIATGEWASQGEAVQ